MADNEAHVIHISPVIVNYTLQLSSLRKITHKVQVAIYLRNWIKKKHKKLKATIKFKLLKETAAHHQFAMTSILN